MIVATAFNTLFKPPPNEIRNASLFSMVELFIINSAALYIPPPLPKVTPSTPASLPDITEPFLISEGAAPPGLVKFIPPPNAELASSFITLLLLIVELSTITWPSECIPPPPLSLAVLLSIIVPLVIIRTASTLSTNIPPPKSSAVLFVIVQAENVAVEV